MYLVKRQVCQIKNVFLEWKKPDIIKLIVGPYIYSRADEQGGRGYWHVVLWQFHMQTIFLKYSFYLFMSQRYLELPPVMYSEPVRSSENMQVILCQIKIFCHQILNLRIICVNLVNLVVVFWVNW